MMILEGIVNDTRNNTIQEDLSPLCWKAYEQTLKPYHGWMVSQLFSVQILIGCVTSFWSSKSGTSNYTVSNEGLPLAEGSPTCFGYR